MNDEIILSYIANPNFLLNEIDVQLEQVDFDLIPIVALDGSTENQPRVSVENNPFHPVLESVLEPTKGSIHEVCCQRLEYCRIRREHEETVSLIKSVGDSLISAGLMLPLPVLTIAAYCVMSLYLDRICDCT